MNPSPTDSQQLAIESALKLVRTIDNLAGNPDFREFMARFSQRADELAGLILHDDAVSPEQREKLRNRRLGILEILLAPAEDRAAQVRVLAHYGIHPGDGPE